MLHRGCERRRPLQEYPGSVAHQAHWDIPERRVVVAARATVQGVEAMVSGVLEAPIEPMTLSECKGLLGSLNKTHGVGQSPNLYIKIERRLLATIFALVHNDPVVTARARHRMRAKR